VNRWICRTKAPTRCSWYEARKILTQKSRERNILPIDSFLEPLEPIAKFCSQRKLADDRGTHAEKKGPLQDATRERPRDEKQGWRNPGNGLVLDPALRIRPGRIDKPDNRTYFLRALRAKLSKPSKSIGNAVCLLTISTRDL
jgi:hypothetical protein